MILSWALLFKRYSVLWHFGRFGCFFLCRFLHLSILFVCYILISMPNMPTLIWMVYCLTGSTSEFGIWTFSMVQILMRIPFSPLKSTFILWENENKNIKCCVAFFCLIHSAQNSIRLNSFIRYSLEQWRQNISLTWQKKCSFKYSFGLDRLLSSSSSSDNAMLNIYAFQARHIQLLIEWLQYAWFIWCIA